MDQNIKILSELEKLLTESTSQTVLKPDPAKFKRIVDLINSKLSVPKEFTKMIKSKIMAVKHPRSQLMLFEILEYTTCKCSGALFNEYNNKDFLQNLNSIFNQKTLSDESRNKLLYLIQFWNYVFETKKDIYPNFSWYYNLILSRGVPFPPFKQSAYFEGKLFVPQTQAQVLPQAQFQSKAYTPEPVSHVQTPSQNDDVFDTMNDKQKKLFKDLSVVFENLLLANSMMDQNERDLDEVIKGISKMEKKLEALPGRLMESNEGFLHAYCLAILEDTTFTLNRYTKFMQRQPAPKFNSSAQQIIDQARQMFNQQNQPTNDEFGSAPKQGSNNLLEEVQEFGGKGQTGQFNDHQGNFEFSNNSPPQIFNNQNQAQAFGGQNAQFDNNFGFQNTPQNNAPGQQFDGFNQNEFGFGEKKVSAENDHHQHSSPVEVQGVHNQNAFGGFSDGFGNEHNQQNNQFVDQGFGNFNQTQHQQESPFGGPATPQNNQAQNDHFSNF